MLYNLIYSIILCVCPICRNILLYYYIILYLLKQYISIILFYLATNYIIISVILFYITLNCCLDINYNIRVAKIMFPRIISVILFYIILEVRDGMKTEDNNNIKVDGRLAIEPTASSYKIKHRNKNKRGNGRMSYVEKSKKLGLYKAIIGCIFGYRVEHPDCTYVDMYNVLCERFPAVFDGHMKYSGNIAKMINSDVGWSNAYFFNRVELLGIASIQLKSILENSKNIDEKYILQAFEKINKVDIEAKKLEIEREKLELLKKSTVTIEKKPDTNETIETINNIYESISEIESDQSGGDIDG